MRFALESLRKQTFRDFIVLFVDNASEDGSVQYIHEYFPTVSILKNTRNVGFARAHNQAMRIQPAPFVLVMNPDIILQPTYLETLLTDAEAHPRSGSFGGKLLRFQLPAGELSEAIYSDTLDSAGLRGFPSRRVIDRGSGEHDTGQYDRSESVFGISGALALYRRTALEDVRLVHEFFDEDFFLYKEDVDLSWRLQLRGWEAHYVPAAVAYHHREAQRATNDSPRSIVQNRRRKQQRINYYSYKNHLHTLVKNESLRTIVRHLVSITWDEVRKLAYLILLEPKTLRSVRDFWKEFPRMRKKREIILRQRTVTDDTIDRWFQKT